MGVNIPTFLAITAALVFTLQLCYAKKPSENLFGLTPAEIKNLRKAFKVFKSDKSALNETKRALILMFKVTPVTQKLFPKIANVSVNDLHKNREFIELAKNTLEYVTGFIKHVDNVGKASLYLKFIKGVFKNNLERISDFTFNIYHTITRVNDRLAAVKYWKYWQVRKNAKTKNAALSKWKEAEKVTSSADTALMKILARIDQLVGGLVTKNYFGISPVKLEIIKNTWRNFTKNEDRLDKVILRVIQEAPDTLKLSPGIQQNSIGNMKDPKYKSLVENYIQLVSHCIEAMENFEKSEEFLSYIEKKFGKSKIQAVKTIRKHLTLNPIWAELEDLPDIYSVMNKISHILYIITNSMEKNMPLKLE